MIKTPEAIQTSGLAAIVVGVGVLAGIGWALLAFGAACVVVGVALERGDD